MLAIANGRNQHSHLALELLQYAPAVTKAPTITQRATARQAHAMGRPRGAQATIVDDYGGFLRKVSTTIYHLHRKEHRRFKRVFSGCGRLDIFNEISASEFKALATYI